MRIYCVKESYWFKESICAIFSSEEEANDFISNLKVTTWFTNYNIIPVKIKMPKCESIIGIRKDLKGKQ